MLGVTALSLLIAAATTTMQIRSSDFSPNGRLPLRAMATDCGGKNESPGLSWSGIPAGTKSFALVVHDPDAPLPGGFYHWVVYNIPASAQGLPANATLANDRLGLTSRGQTGYDGPCPPSGPLHRYFFTVYALDLVHISTASPLSAPQLEARIKGHVLARAAIEGTASHP